MSSIYPLNTPTAFTNNAVLHFDGTMVRIAFGEQIVEQSATAPPVTTTVYRFAVVMPLETFTKLHEAGAKLIAQAAQHQQIWAETGPGTMQ